MQHRSMTVLGYVRVSTDEQGDSGAGLAAQRSAIEQECERRGWTLAGVIEDVGYSAKNLRRPGIQNALEQLRGRGVEGLVVAKLDRLSRSMLDFTTLMAQAQKQGWSIVALDCDVDTTTPAGEAMANVIATFAQFERRLIGQRTKEALAAKRAQASGSVARHRSTRTCVPGSAPNARSPARHSRRSRSSSTPTASRPRTAARSGGRPRCGQRSPFPSG